MIKILLSILIIFYAISVEAKNIFDEYADFKNNLNTQYGINYGIATIVTKQYAYSSKQHQMGLGILSPYASLTFPDMSYGQGQVHFAMNVVRFQDKTSWDISDKIKVANQIDYYDMDYDELSELYYEHTFKTDEHSFSFGVGQIPIIKFDMVSYEGYSSYFLNNALAQNGTFAYPSAGLGGYGSARLSKNAVLNIGAMDATNPTAQGIKTKKLNNKKIASFASFQYTPKLFNTYEGSYNFLIYKKPAVEKAPYRVKGWSVYLTQKFQKNMALFVRLNGASGNYTSLKKSYAIGGIFNRLIKTDENDQLGIGYAYNRVNQNSTTKPLYHKYEQTLEIYYHYPIAQNISVRPDIQFYINPAFDKKTSVPMIFSLGLSVDL